MTRVLGLNFEIRKLENLASQLSRMRGNPISDMHGITRNINQLIISSSFNFNQFFQTWKMSMF